MEELSISDYLRVAARGKKTIITTVILALVAAGIVLIFMPRTYEGKTSLLFPPQAADQFSSRLSQISGLPLIGGLPILTGRDIYANILKSRTLSENVYSTLKLGSYGIKPKDLAKNLSLDTPKEGGLILTCEVPTSWLKGKAPRSQLADNTANLAAEIANTYISELRVYERENALFLGRKNRLFIEDQLEATQSRLTRAEDELEAFQRVHPALIPPDRSSEYANTALSLVTQRTSTDVDLEQVNAQVSRARKTWDEGAPKGISPEAVIDTPAISDLQRSLAALEVRRATFLENFTESHPDVVKISQDIAKTQEELRSQISRVVSGRAGSADPAHQELLKQIVLLEVNYDGLKARRSALTRAIANTERRLSGLPSKEIEYARLLRNVKAAETVYTTLLAEHAKAQIAEGRDADSFVVLDVAKPREKPSKPRVTLTLAAALMLGLLVGFFTAAARGVPERVLGALTPVALPKPKN